MNISCLWADIYSSGSPVNVNNFVNNAPLLYDLMPGDLTTGYAGNQYYSRYGLIDLGATLPVGFFTLAYHLYYAAVGGNYPMTLWASDDPSFSTYTTLYNFTYYDLADIQIIQSPITSTSARYWQCCFTSTYHQITDFRLYDTSKNYYNPAVIPPSITNHIPQALRHSRLKR